MRILNALSIGIFLLFLGVYCYEVSLNFQNFPIADDYEAFFDFNNDFFALKGFWEKVQLVFSQHNEHRIATLRIINLTYFYFFGKIDLAVFRILGLVFYIFSMFFLYLEGEFSLKRFYFFLPIPILMLSFAYAEIYYLAMESLSHFPMIFFTLATIYTSISRKFTFLPMIFLFFGVFSNGNGILLMPIVFVGLTLQKEFKRLFVWAVFSILISCLYFYDYGSGKSVLSLDIIPYLIKVYPIYVGGIGGFGSLKMNLVLGILALALTLFFFIFRKSYKKELSLTLILVFYLLTFLIISIKRNERGTEFLQRGAYLINSVMIFVLLYLLFFKEFLRPWKLEKSFKKVSFFFVLILLAGVIYQIKNYRTWRETLKYNEIETRNDEIMYLGNTFDLYKDRKTIYNIPLVSNHRIDGLVQKGYFDLDKVKESVVSKMFDASKFKIQMKSKGCGFEIRKIEGFAIKENPYLRIKGKYRGVFQARSLKLGIVLEYKGEKSFFLIPALNAHLSLFEDGKAQSIEFDFLLPKKYFPNDGAKVSIFSVGEDILNVCDKWLFFRNDFDNDEYKATSKVSLLTETTKFKEDTVSRPILEEAFSFNNTHEIVLDLTNLKNTNKSTKYYLIFHGDDGLSFMSDLKSYNSKSREGIFYTKFEFGQVKHFLKKRNSVFKLDLLSNTDDQMFVSHLEYVYYLHSKGRLY